MARYKNADWNLRGKETDDHVENSVVQIAVLMDLRDELQRLNTLLHCQNFQQIPAKLEAIRRNTTKKKR